MEDSLEFESNLVLVVPSSVENSESNALGSPSDNPLGISSRALRQITGSAGSEQLASFSCFELSGRERDLQSETSESLHIDEGDGDIIPSSPGVMHIDLANTPSVAPSSGLSATTTTTPFESCESGDGDMESGNMSPDLIPSSDASSIDMMFSSPRSQELNESARNPQPTKNPGQSRVSVLGVGKQEPLPQSSENLFEADTETYSPSNFPVIIGVNGEQDSSSFSLLEKAKSMDFYPSPVILTASTQSDSDFKRENLPVKSFLLNRVESAKIDLNEKASELEENPRKKSNGVMDIDSQEIVIKDVKMSSSQDEENSPKEGADDQDEKCDSFPEAMESQDYTQEDLNLHLTFESQLFSASSFTNADSHDLVIDEQTTTHNAPATTDDRPQSAAMLDSQHKPIISSNESDNSSSGPCHDASTGDKCSAVELLPDLEMPLNHADSPLSTRINNDVHDQDTSDNLPKYGNKNPEMIELAEVGSQSAAPPTDRGSPNVPHLETRSEMSQDCGSQDVEGRDDDAQSISASVTMVGNSNSGNGSQDRSQPVGKESLDPIDKSCELQIVSRSAQDISLHPSIPPNNSQKDPVTSDGESLPLNLSSIFLKVGRDKEEVSPSMQSTYTNENNINNRATSQSLAVSEPRNDSLESVFSSQPISSCYDASVSNSSMEPDTDLMSIPLNDLETQPFTLTSREELCAKRTFPQNHQQEQTTKPQDEDQSPLFSPEQTNSKLKRSVGEEIRSLINELIESTVAKSSGKTVARTNSTAGTSQSLSSDAKGQSSKVTLPDKNIQTNKDQLLSKVYDYPSQSQPSQNIHLKLPFHSPTNSFVREKSGSGKGGEKGGRRKMEKDSNNNEKDDQGVSNEEHDKSSDTLPPDDSAGHDSDPLLSPPQGSRLNYRVLKTVVIETISNDQVIETRTIHRKPKMYSQDPYPASSSQSSNGSGYLADTSSISRTSSDSSTQTNISQSPGGILRHPTEPALRSELSGSSTSSVSSTSTEFRVPGHPLKAISSPKRQKSSTLDSKLNEKSASPIAIIRSPSSTGATPVCSASMSSPSLKEGRVVLTQLSTELIAASIGTMGAKFYGDIATPPTCNINPPPLSGSTPVETPQKDDSASDITTSNSPEIGYPGDSIQGSSFPCDPSPRVGREKPPGRNESVQEFSERISFAEGIPVMARLPTEPYFYPGMMRAEDPKSGKYSVFFEDDCRERMIREHDVLLIDKLTVGQEVFVHSDSDDPSDWYSPGIILSYWRENDERGYVIEKSDTVFNTKHGRRYSRKSVIVRLDNLTKEQKLSRVQPLLGTTTADVSLDNIVDGKRRSRRSKRGSLATSSPASSRTPSPSTSKTPKSSMKRRISDSQSSGSSSFVPFPSTKKSKRAKLMYGSSRTMTRKEQSSETKAQVTYKDSKIFGNCVFLLTATTGKDHPSSEFDSPPSEPTHGYDRVDIRRKIIAGRGEVVKNFTELMASDRAQRYVISDDYCRTMNYLNALGAGIICLSYVFINDSTSLGKLKLTTSYKLPAGYSLQHQTSVERSSVYIQPLSGLRIHLQMRDNTTWSPLLILAGCDTVSSRQDAMKDECPLACDVVVADASCSATLFERAKLLKIHVVSIEWIIQCLITTEKLPFDGHPQFKQFD